MIPEAAVEAAVAKLPPIWTTSPAYHANLVQALEAAAPYMLATVYEEGWLAARDFYLSTDGPEGGLDANPYRSQS